MSSKPPGGKPPMHGDNESPSVKPSRSRKPAESVPVKVIKGQIAKNAPKKPAPKKPVKAPAKPAAATQKAPAKPKATPRKKAGTTVVTNPVKLSKPELEALQAGSLHGLDERQAKFVDLWLVTQNGTLSYIDAGFECKSDSVAAAAASRLLRKVKEHPYLLAKRAEMFKRTAEIQDRVLGKVYGAAMADPRELVEYVYKCCRHCHGIDHQYQMTPRQLKDRTDEHKSILAASKIDKTVPKPGPLDTLGGLGFDQNRDPHEDCPECNGNGIPRLVLKDTRYLSPGALALYGGVKEGKDGIEIKISDQRPYLEMLARLFNMDVEREAPMVAVVSKDELDGIYQRAQAATNAQRERMAERAAEVAKMQAGSEE